MRRRSLCPLKRMPKMQIKAKSEMLSFLLRGTRCAKWILKKTKLGGSFWRGYCGSLHFHCHDEALWATPSWGGKSLLDLHFHTVDCPWNEVRTGTEAGVDAEAVEKCCLLAQSAHFLYNQGQPAQGWYHPQWTGPPPPITNEEIDVQVCLLSDLIEAFSYLKIPHLRWM